MIRFGLASLLVCSLFSGTVAHAENFVENGNGTVTDNRTGLTWQQGEPGQMSWGDALSYCEAVSLAGHEDWRLPNVKELESMTDDSRSSSAIDTVFFPNAYASYYWSSTTAFDFYQDHAWFVYFNDGLVGNGYKGSYYYVRCVRGGQSG